MLSKDKIDIESHNKCAIMKFSRPLNLELFPEGKIEYEGITLHVLNKSHIENEIWKPIRVFFRFNVLIYSQQDDHTINRSRFGFHNNVVLICFLIPKKKEPLTMGNVKDFIYGDKNLLKLDRKCL